MPQHKHFCCSCDNYCTCRREDCETFGWQCQECADQEQSDYFAVVGDQPRLPLEEPEHRSELVETF